MSAPGESIRKRMDGASTRWTVTAVRTPPAKPFKNPQMLRTLPEISPQFTQTSQPETEPVDFQIFDLLFSTRVGNSF